MSASLPAKAAPKLRQGSLFVAPELQVLVAERVLPGLSLTPARFWSVLEDLVTGLGPRNRMLLERRDALQAQIDAWHRAHPGASFPSPEYRTFLQEIGYLVPPAPPVAINPQNVDPEIARLAAPQLVVPVTNARYALNAANARWGSLYDAL